MDYGKVPWPRLRDYLLCVGSCRNRSDFLRAACIEIQRIVPFDVAANVFSMVDLSYLGGTSPRSMEISYNSYYRYHHVFTAIHARDWDAMSPVVDWRRFGGFEFAVDFMWPNGIWKSLQQARPEQQIVLTVHRSRLSPGFASWEADTMGLINQYLNDLSSSMEKRSEASSPLLSPQMIADGFQPLSRREADVCSLVARRLTTAEIAACLFVSPRTVEKHVERIFEKLEVRSRGQLRRRLERLDPASGWEKYVVPTHGRGAKQE